MDDACLRSGREADDHDDAAAADTGCITPTASRAGAAACEADDDGAATDGIGSTTPTASRRMAALPQPDGGADDTSYAAPTTCRTAAPLDGSAAGDATVCFTTPTKIIYAKEHRVKCWGAALPCTTPVFPALHNRGWAPRAHVDSTTAPSPRALPF